MLVRQRTQLVNALRGHLAEFGVTAPKGIVHLGKLLAAMEDKDPDLPELVRHLARRQIEQIEALTCAIEDQDKTLRQITADETTAALLRTIPGAGPLTAAAVQAFAPPLDTFSRGRDFAGCRGCAPPAWRSWSRAAVVA